MPSKAEPDSHTLRQIAQGLQNGSDHISAPFDFSGIELCRNWSVIIPIYSALPSPDCAESAQIAANAAIFPVQTDQQVVLLTPHLGTVLESNRLQATKQVPRQ